MGQTQQRRPTSVEQEPVAQEEGGLGAQGLTLDSEWFTGAALPEAVAEAEERVDELVALEASFTPHLDAAWEELAACTAGVEAVDSDRVAEDGMELVDEVISAEPARTLPSVSRLELGIIEEDQLSVVEDFGEHPGEWAELLGALPDGLPAWSAELGDEAPKADEAPASTIERVLGTTADLVVAEEVVALCATMRGDDEAGQAALRELVELFHRAPEALRPTLDAVLEAQELSDLHIHDVRLGVTRADLLDEMEAEDAELAESVDRFELDESGSGFVRGLGHVIDVLAGRARTEFEAEGSLKVPVYGPLLLTGTAKVTVSRGASDTKAVLLLEGGLGVGTKDGDAYAALEGGYTLEAQARDGRQVAQLLQLGLLDSLASCRAEPPPIVFDLVLGTLMGASTVLPMIDGTYRAVDRLQGGNGKSLVWSVIADAFVSPARRRELLASMEDGDYVESFDYLLGKGAVTKGGSGAKGSAKGGIVRRIEQQHGQIDERDWIGVKLGKEVSLGDDDGVTAKFEMKDVLQRKVGDPPDTSSQIKLALEGTVASGSFDGADLLFGALGLSYLQAAFVQADVEDEHREQLPGMETLMVQTKGLALRALAEQGYEHLPGVSLGLEVELAFAPRTGVWTVSAALVSKGEVDAKGAAVALQRKETLVEREIDPAAAAGH